MVILGDFVTCTNSEVIGTHFLLLDRQIRIILIKIPSDVPFWRQILNVIKAPRSLGRAVRAVRAVRHGRNFSKVNHIKYNGSALTGSVRAATAFRTFRRFVKSPGGRTFGQVLKLP